MSIKFFCTVFFYLFSFSLLASCGSPAKIDSEVQSGTVFAQSYSGVDVGEKINNAIDDVFSKGGGVVLVSTEIWGNVKFKQGIRLKSGVHLVFPGSNVAGIYNGRENAIELIGVSRSRVSGLGLRFGSESQGNAIYLKHAFDNLFDGGMMIKSPKQNGILIDAGNKGSYHNYFRGPIRILKPGESHIRLVRTGKVHPNANYFDGLVLNTPRGGHAAISIEAGYSNSFSNVYIQSGEEDSWAIFHKGWGWNQVDNITIDGDMPNGVHVHSGNLMLSQVKNNAKEKTRIGRKGNLTSFSSTGDISVTSLRLNSAKSVECDFSSEGLLVYDYSKHEFKGCDGISWVNLN